MGFEPMTCDTGAVLKASEQGRWLSLIRKASQKFENERSRATQENAGDEKKGQLHVPHQ